jgi:hypothetical protein
MEIWRKSKLNSEKIWKIWKISVLVIITPRDLLFLVFWMEFQRYCCRGGGGRGGGGWRRRRRAAAEEEEEEVSGCNYD